MDNGPGAAFAAFLIAADTPSTIQCFTDLLASTNTPPNAGRAMLETLREKLLPHLKWRQAQLLKQLSERKASGALCKYRTSTRRCPRLSKKRAH